ncbi:pilus assembly protein PilM [Alkalicoccus chagannorensis]|uniref:pilus assembly protein PilM n=1 Tax=Alkalicoccus chagannorensis TaxID=427072 RepID=UPI00047CC105|nr:pilus assembly protein PilM [Alkalicoccus chagannorensis]
MSSSYIFGIDIGTRSVVGLLLEKREEGYHVIDLVSREHQERSMLDGQIHNVMETAETISWVKEKLENKHGPLPRVCAAAAGRSLQTQRAEKEIAIQGSPIINRESLLHMELAAVQQGQHELAQSSTGSEVYCVGYSVLNYKLDGELIGSLIDQQGHTASVEVIATFLPKVVVESLIAALQRAGLTLEALTLEPIAAIQVLVPASMRRLNIALVDIGAGTSDIAITDQGTVTAYGMVPMAGDAVTEAVSDQYLLDFPDAEILKRQLHANEEVEMQDVLGMVSSRPAAAVIEELQPVVRDIASNISREILRLNGRPPKAVMLVGGGALTPNLPELVAQNLELPADRVAVRGTDAVKNLSFPDHIQPTPELVTPVGIAAAAREHPIEYLSVTVNGSSVRLFDMKNVTVGDALIASGVQLSDLHGRPGLASIVKINERSTTIPGTHGYPPRLTVNGENAGVETSVQDGDAVVISRGDDGSPGSAVIADLLDDQLHLQVTINHEPVTIEADIALNGIPVTSEHPVSDKDNISISYPKTCGDVLSWTGEQTSPQGTAWVNEEPFSWGRESHLTKNGRPAEHDTKIYSGDVLHVETRETETPTIKDLLLQYDEEAVKDIHVSFQGKPLYLERAARSCLVEGEPVPLETPVSDGWTIETEKRDPGAFIFQDVFAQVDIEQPADQTKQPVILRNGEHAQFSSLIRHGDELELKWIASSRNASS